MKEDYSDGIQVSIELSVEGEDSGQNTSIMPERKLFTEVIKRAIQDLKSVDPSLVIPAKEWFLEDEVDNPEFTSFQSICYILDLDFKTLRDAIFVYASCPNVKIIED